MADKYEMSFSEITNQITFPGLPGTEFEARLNDGTLDGIEGVNYLQTRSLARIADALTVIAVEMAKGNTPPESTLSPYQRALRQICGQGDSSPQDDE